MKDLFIYKCKIMQGTGGGDLSPLIKLMKKYPVTQLCCVSECVARSFSPCENCSFTGDAVESLMPVRAQTPVHGAFSLAKCGYYCCQETDVSSNTGKKVCL